MNDLSAQLQTFLGEDLPMREDEQSSPQDKQLRRNKWKRMSTQKIGIFPFGSRKMYCATGMDPLSFIRYMATIGDIGALTTLHDNLPAAEEMDPESCYLGFEIDLKIRSPKRGN